MRILVTGPQGSGKTTQAKLLSDKLNLCFVKAGEMVREKAKGLDEEAKLAKKALETGDLVDNKLIAKLVSQKVSQKECQLGYVMDGYPRSVDQLSEFNPQYDKVVLLNLSDQEATRRLLARSREDDTPELIKERLFVYHKKTSPVLQHYKDHGKLIEVNGEQPEKKVTDDILEALGVNG